MNPGFGSLTMCISLRDAILWGNSGDCVEQTPQSHPEALGQKSWRISVPMMISHWLRPTPNGVNNPHLQPTVPVDNGPGYQRKPSGKDMPYQFCNCKA